MLPPEDVQIIMRLHQQGWGKRRIARELGIAPNTVVRYLRAGGYVPYQQPQRVTALDGLEDWLRETFLKHGGNAAVVHQELSRQHGIELDPRTVQRAVKPYRLELEARAKATVRFETPPGKQLQADFGQRKVRIAGGIVAVFLAVLTLGFSRRIYVRAFQRERREHWLAAIEGALLHFGGVPQELLVDNARALVDEHDLQRGRVVFNPVFADFCRWWGITPRACAPYRARTKGKDERAIRYVKHNALAGHDFESWSGLEGHLEWWMREIADLRVHGTTEEKPIERFEREERAALAPLGSRAGYPAQLVHSRRVQTDACIEFETNHYSVPWRLLGQIVTLRASAEQIIVLHGGHEVAAHRRSYERQQRFVVPEHLDGIVRTRRDLLARLEGDAAPVAAVIEEEIAPPSSLLRPLDEYQALIEEVG